MKNQRDVCYAKDAGCIRFKGLPGLIKTGCPLTPAFMSRYCQQHKPQVCTALLPHNRDADDSDDEMDVATGTAPLRSNRYPGGAVAEMILAKKVTRKQTYYQVYSCCA